MTWTAPWEASENPHQPLFSPVTLITPRSCLFTKGGLPTGCDSVFVSPALRCLVIDQCAVNVDWMNELWMGLAGCPEVAHLLRLGDCLPMRLRCCGCSLHWSRDLYSNPSVVPDIQAHGLGWYCVSWMVLCVFRPQFPSQNPPLLWGYKWNVCDGKEPQVDRMMGAEPSNLDHGAMICSYLCSFWAKAAHSGLQGCLPLLFSHYVMSDSMRPHGLQNARLLCPPLPPVVCSNSSSVSR